MKNFKILIISILTFTSFSCQENEEELLVASDELHLIKLDKQDRFELIYNGLNKATGNYRLDHDTIYLKYIQQDSNEIDFNSELTQKLLIDKKRKKIRSIDNKQFCADIQINNLEVK